MEEYNYPLYIRSASCGLKVLIYEFVLRRARLKCLFSVHSNKVNSLFVKRIEPVVRLTKQLCICGLVLRVVIAQCSLKSLVHGGHLIIPPGVYSRGATRICVIT